MLISAAAVQGTLRAENTTDSKEAAKLLDLAAEQLELAEGELASQQHQEAQLKKS